MYEYVHSFTNLTMLAKYDLQYAGLIWLLAFLENVDEVISEN